MEQSKSALLKSMLPGMLPLLVFIAADAFFPEKTSLIIAIVFSFLELGWTYFKEHRLEKFILFDVLLIALLGLGSIGTGNTIYFKLKPALIEIILLAILLMGGFTKVNPLLAMSKRYMKGIEFGERQRTALQRTCRSMSLLVFIHILLVVYSAFLTPQPVWAFVSSALLYIMFGAWVVIAILAKKAHSAYIAKKYARSEWFDIVDTDGKVTGRAPREICHKGPGLLHPVVHLHVFDRQGRLYLQKRSMAKDIQPGKWDTAVGGHVNSGEQITDALIRESKEELGIDGFQAEFLYRYVWESERESELVHTFMCRWYGQIHFDPSEIDEGRFWSLSQIEKSLGLGIFTPNFEQEFKLLRRTASSPK